MSEETKSGESEEKKNEEIKDNILGEIKKLEENKEKLNKSISEIDNFSQDLKSKMNKEDVSMQSKLYQSSIEKEKIKNENELTILTQNNEKMEKYIQLLAKQYELELQYIEQYCDFKSKVEKLGEKYAHINISAITPLQESFSEQLNNDFTKSRLPSSKPITTNQMRVAPKNHEHINEVPTRQNTQTQNESEISPKRRNTIATIAENNPVKDDIRNSGNLQDHLKDALSKRFQAMNE